MAHVWMRGRQAGPFVVFPPGAKPVVFAPTGGAFAVRQLHVFRDRGISDAIRVSAVAASAASGSQQDGHRDD